MELKHIRYFFMCLPCIVLIVPYGIETYLERVAIARRNQVLIVPYGIETHKIIVLCVVINPGVNCTLWN